MRHAWLAPCLAALVAATASPQAAPTWVATRDLRIDASEQDLSPIDWLTVAPNGTIVAAQRQDMHLRFFDSSGRSLGSFGRAGGGPGEFRHLGRTGWVADTLWVTDPSQRRSTFIRWDRELVRTQPQLATVRFEGGALDTLHTQLGVFPWAHLSGGRSLVMVLRSAEAALIRWPGSSGRGDPLLHVDASGTLLNVVAELPEGPCSARYALPGGSGSTTTPFCTGPRRETSPTGSRVVLAEVEEQARRRVAYRVTAQRPSGDTIFSRVLEAAPRMVPRKVADSVTDRRIAQARYPQEVEAIRGMRVPEVYPPFVRLLAGRDDTAWLEEPTQDGERSWLVLDSTGRSLARVRLPRAVQLQVASRTTAWGTETDDDGLQHIVRYRVTAR